MATTRPRKLAQYLRRRHVPGGPGKGEPVWRLAVADTRRTDGYHLRDSARSYRPVVAVTGLMPPLKGGLAGLMALPRAAWLCAAIGALTAITWGLLIPPFQVADETVHTSYVQYLAEHGRPPPGDRSRPSLSDEQVVTMKWLRTAEIVGNPRNRSVMTDLEQARLTIATQRRLARGNAGGPNEATSQPPLYYALEAIPYRLSPSRRLLDRIVVMRLGSALFAAGTVLFVYLFLREVFPRRAWAWTVGALSVAFQPTFGYVAGGVTPDNLLFCVSAGLFFAVARAFRRGLTPGVGAAIGAATSIGILSKLTFVGMLPGVFLALALALSASGPHQNMARRGALAAAVTAVVPLTLYIAVNGLLWHRAVFPAALHSGAVAAGDGSGGITRGSNLTYGLSYTWQLYLPRLPFMVDLFAYFPPYETWWKGFIGRFGWLDFGFPLMVYKLALGVGIALAGLGIRAVARYRRRVPGRWREIAAYGAIALGLMVEIGFAGLDYRNSTGYIFEQARYLLPLLPLYAAAIVLSAYGAGDRRAPLVGAVIVIGAMAHDIFSQLLTISRYYG